jgi:hypothetical protein
VRQTQLGITLRCANTDRVNGWAEILHRLGDPKNGVPPRLFIHERCARLVECLPSLQHDPNRPEDVLKVDADEDGVGGDDTADCMRYLVATKSRVVAQRKLRGVVMKLTNRSGGVYGAALRALGEWISWVVVEECVFVLEPRLIAAQQNSAESKDYSLRRQNDPVAPVVNESFQRRNTHESFVGGGSEQTSVGPRHVCVVSVEPTLKATAIKHLYVADRNHCQAQDGEEMEEVESAGEMVDAEGSHVKHKHGQNVSHANDAMESRAFEVEQNEGAEHETAYSGNDLED